MGTVMRPVPAAPGGVSGAASERKPPAGKIASDAGAETDSAAGSGSRRSRARGLQEQERRLAALELEIREYEGLLSVLEKRLSDPASHSDAAASQALADEYAQVRAYLDARYEEWLALQ